MNGVYRVWPGPIFFGGSMSEVSSNRNVLVISLILLAAAGAVVFVGLGQFRANEQALRLCRELKETSAALQAAAERLAAAEQNPPRTAQAGTNAPFQELPQEIQSDDSMQAYMDALTRRNLEQHEQDAARYGEDLSSLYREALDEEGSGSRESNRAFGQLVEKYPDANVTGMAIANRGLLAAMKQKTEDVEMFRNMLSRKEPFTRIVTDSHIDAYPALCGFLANRYVTDGRTDDAEVLLAELEKKFPQCYVAVGGLGSGPMLVPVARFVERVRREAKGTPPQRQPPQRGPAGS